MGPGYVQNECEDKGFEAHRGYLVATLPLVPQDPSFNINAFLKEKWGASGIAMTRCNSLWSSSLLFSFDLSFFQKQVCTC